MSSALGAFGRLRLLAVLATAGLFALCSCSVDTELGVAADIESAAVTVTGTGADAVVSLAIVVTFRVGEHALGSRTFQVPRADVRVGEAPVATVNLDRPPAFDGTLAPGESEMVTLAGATPNPNADAMLCAGAGVSATLLIRYEHRDAMDGTALPDVDTAQLATTDITCL